MLLKVQRLLRKRQGVEAAVDVFKAVVEV
jgi:hypothetical protein